MQLLATATIHYLKGVVLLGSSLDAARSFLKAF